jgi:hypothetical protein
MSPILGARGGLSASAYGLFAPSLALNSYESIATYALGTTTASVTFSSIPSTYKHLQIRYMARQNVTGADRGAMEMQFNSDTGANYSYHLLFGDGSSASALAYTSTDSIYTGLSDITTASTASNIFGVGVIDILDYQNTNKYKTTRSLSGQDQNSTSGRIFFTSGNWRSTSAINTITLYPEAGSFVQYSHLALYGIRG